MPTFLLEIRTEEIPAAALPGARRQIAELFDARLVESGFFDLSIKALSTSRRLRSSSTTFPHTSPTAPRT